jgi:ornithine carbamoyltransferase
LSSPPAKIETGKGGELKRDLVSLSDWSAEGIGEVLELAAHLKREQRAGMRHDHILRGKTLAMIFQKPSLRTRVSFEVGMWQLGGYALYLGPEDIKLGQRETVEDVALNLSRYVDGIMARVFGHEVVEELARFATVPVINGLSDLLHPCQALADMFTIWEKTRKLAGLTLAYIGDGNNVANSLIQACAKLGLSFRIACPEGHEPAARVLAEARALGAKVEILRSPKEAARDADVLYTDVWTSMGQEAEAELRRRKFQGYTVDLDLLSLAKPNALVMHCLPAHYGEEITYEAARARNSVIFDQAENRLHAQKALLALLLGGKV